MNVAHRKYLLRNRIVGIVRHHWKCIEYINLLDSYYSIPIVLQYLIATIIFTLKLYKIYECVKINHFRKIIIILIDIIQNYVFMFLYFCPATKLTKHSEILLNSAYNACWYETFVHIQKMFKFVIQNTLKSYHLGILEIFCITFESMGKVYISFNITIILR
ncbi:uncharacterized protein LOC105736786 [Apis florea]|uniref:uncharacterized protein LOC105736786 n=1 Tax=Apis florea TaxID=7463 RepID=UPI0012FEF8E1|nr:uncharacterized protein LOC105736786 [Apis florea]